MTRQWDVTSFVWTPIIYRLRPSWLEIGYNLLIDMHSGAQGSAARVGAIGSLGGLRLGHVLG